MKVKIPFALIVMVCFTSTSPLQSFAQTCGLNMAEFDCAKTISELSKSWIPIKDSIFRYTPFSLRNKGANAEFLGRIATLTECCCPRSLASMDSLNKKFPKPDATIKTDSQIKVCYFFRIKEYSNYKSKKLKLSDNIPYTIILTFDKKTDLLVDVITN